MSSYVIAKLKHNLFGFKVDNVIRVINITKVTPLPNVENYIEGVVTFEGGSLKVVNFRKLIQYETIKEEFILKLESLFYPTTKEKLKIDAFIDQCINLSKVESNKLKDFTFDDHNELPKLFKKFVEIF